MDLVKRLTKSLRWLLSTCGLDLASVGPMLMKKSLNLLLMSSLSGILWGQGTHRHGVDQLHMREQELRCLAEYIWILKLTQNI